MYFFWTFAKNLVKIDQQQHLQNVSAIDYDVAKSTAQSIVWTSKKICSQRVYEECQVAKISAELKHLLKTQYLLLRNDPTLFYIWNWEAIRTIALSDKMYMLKTMSPIKRGQ
ncbi:hypothetical protein [Anabaena subtropica]|uniref:Transposase n=1 Tax=Anabaena subtropica FACHB-260 TaxID=2692884 RepID=A0ABR8CPW5_9NOST|nr:hypothetical protein [Anabaena subtropica]MBD2345241.1 hypothetical protein [Anabaena subtropica FACHB-260]